MELDAKFSLDKFRLKSVIHKRCGVNVIGDEMKIFKNEKIASRIIEGQAFIVTPLDSTLHLLNEVGTRIWQLIEEKKNIEKIIEHICAEYNVDGPTAEKDVFEFLQTLEKKKIIKTQITTDKIPDVRPDDTSG